MSKRKCSDICSKDMLTTLLQEKKQNRQIAKMFNISESSVVNLINHYKLQEINKERHIPISKDDFLSFYKTNPRSIRAVVKHFHISADTVKKLSEIYEVTYEYSRQQINKNKPSKEAFIQWINTQPDGITGQKIAEHYSITIDNVRNWLKSWNINLTSLGKGKRITNKPSKEKFIQWVNVQPDGITGQEIAEHYSISISTLSKWFKSWDITLRSLKKDPHISKNKPSKEEFIQWINVQPENITYQKITDHYLITKSTLSSWFRAWNINLTSLGKGHHATPNKPSKENFIQWFNTQPNDITGQKIAEHYSVTMGMLYGWFKSWNINLTSLGKRKHATNKPSRDDFIQWINTQPDNITGQKIAEHYSVTMGMLYKWFKSWDINLTLLGKGLYMPNVIVRNNYCLDLTKTNTRYIRNTLTQSNFDYKHMVILVKDGLESQIYVCTQDDQEFIKTPVELIDEYIERSDKDKQEQTLKS